MAFLLSLSSRHFGDSFLLFHSHHQLLSDHTLPQFHLISSRLVSSPRLSQSKTLPFCRDSSSESSPAISYQRYFSTCRHLLDPSIANVRLHFRVSYRALCLSSRISKLAVVGNSSQQAFCFLVLVVHYPVALLRLPFLGNYQERYCHPLPAHLNLPTTKARTQQTNPTNRANTTSAMADNGPPPPGALLPPPPTSVGAPGYENGHNQNTHMPPPPLAPVVIPQNNNPIPTAMTSPMGENGMMSPDSAGGFVRRAAPEPNKRALYVGGLDPRVTEDVLRQIFETTGHVQNVKIIPDKNVGAVSSDSPCFFIISGA